MKASLKLFLAAGLCACVALSCQKYDDTQLRNDISSLSSRVATLENWKNSAQGNIQSLLTLTEGLNKNYYITAINKLEDGYEFVFSNGSKATIKDGHSPAIGVKKDTDGEYYWTLDGEWLKDTGGNKIRVTGEAPQLKIEDGFWFVSTNQGASWTKLGQATGDKGNPGDKGDKGDSMFKEVTYDANFVYFVLADNTTLKVSRGANGVQAIAPIPDYADGSVKADPTLGLEIRFKIIPESAAESLGSLADGCFVLDAFYTSTKANAGDKLVIPITSRQIANGILKLQADKSVLTQFFHSSAYGLSVSLTINDGVVAVTSPYVPLHNTEIMKIMNHDYVEMGDGLKWATCNMGANSPEEYGDFYAWAETDPYYESGSAYDNSPKWKTGKNAGYHWLSYKWMEDGKYEWKYVNKYTFKDGQTTGSWYETGTFRGDNGDGIEHKNYSSYSYADDPARKYWRANWRTPTAAEWEALSNSSNFNWIWTNDYKGTGSLGMIVTSKVPGYEGNSIFLPAGGFRRNVDLNQWTEYGYYWSSSSSTARVQEARCLKFTYSSSSVSIVGNLRFYGFAVRPVTE